MQKASFLFTITINTKELQKKKLSQLYIQLCTKCHTEGGFEKERDRDRQRQRQRHTEREKIDTNDNN